MADITPAHSYPRKRGGRISKAFIRLLLFFTALFFIYLGANKLAGAAASSDVFVIKDIEISGNKNLSKAEIKELLTFKIGDNILKSDLSGAEKIIKDLKPELKEISVKRGWQKITVKLYERTPEAFVLNGKELCGIDFEDKIFPLRGYMYSMQVPEIICKTAQERADLLKFIKIFKPICKDFIGNIAEIKYGLAGAIVFKLRDETDVFWGDTREQQLARKFDKFGKIYIDAKAKHKQIEYIDMTFYGSGRAVVKPKEETARL
ncbi:MAG: FtsQ-type POTRA domain-containing protein [Endomicrobium sp.]|nr:FtsQ-type POTRA domain-containing protein [Endomicrobium sp.]